MKFLEISMVSGGGLPPRVLILTPPKKVDVFLYWTYRFPRHRDRDENKIFLKTKNFPFQRMSRQHQAPNSLEARAVQTQSFRGENRENGSFLKVQLGNKK